MPYQKFHVAVVLVLLFLLVGLPINLTDAADTELLIAWVDHGDLYFWRDSTASSVLLASGDVIHPYIAPGGQYVAFTRGNVLPDTLWLTTNQGDSEQQLVSTPGLSPDSESLYIGQVAWGDSTYLFWNTVRSDAIGFHPQNDLWRVNVRTGSIESLLSAGEGGAFSISPSGQHLAAIYPGTYADQSGHIRLLDLATLAQTDLLAFDSVSTGSEYPFYPEVFWESDSSALRVAIPDPDLIYDELDNPATVLWRLPLNGAPQQTGTVPASLFGQPRWSADMSHLSYLQRVGEATGNRFELLIAEDTGRNETIYAGGAAGEIGLPHWLPGTNQWVYPNDVPGTYWIGELDNPPRQLATDVLALQFVDSTNYVVVTAIASGFELRAAHVSGAPPTLVTAVENAPPVFYATTIPSPQE